MSLDGQSHLFFGVVGILLTPVTGAAAAVETLLFAHRRIRSFDTIQTALTRALQSSPSRELSSPQWSSADQEIAARLFVNLGLDREAETLSRDLCNPDARHRQWMPAPGAVAALELVRRHGIPAGVISGIGEGLEETLAAAGLLPYLGEILTVQESASERRDAEDLRSTLVARGVGPENCWFIGAGPEPALPAVKRIGMNIILVGAEPEDPAAHQARRTDEAVHRLLDPGA